MVNLNQQNVPKIREAKQSAIHALVKHQMQIQQTAQYVGSRGDGRDGIERIGMNDTM